MDNDESIPKFHTFRSQTRHCYRPKCYSDNCAGISMHRAKFAETRHFSVPHNTALSPFIYQFEQRAVLGSVPLSDSLMSPQYIMFNILALQPKIFLLSYFNILAHSSSYSPFLLFLLKLLIVKSHLAAKKNPAIHFFSLHFLSLDFFLILRASVRVNRHWSGHY